MSNRKHTRTFQRGSYDVLAFESSSGSCELKQGTFQINAREVTLWIERNSIGNATGPGKVICMAEGEVVASWGDGRQLRDYRWMGEVV